MVTISLRSREPLLAVLRSGLFLSWFDSVGIEDIPAVFAGDTVEKIASVRPARGRAGRHHGDDRPGVGRAPSHLADPCGVCRGSRHAGIRNLRLFGAFDDEAGVLILQEIETERDASRGWINPTRWPNG